MEGEDFDVGGDFVTRSLGRFVNGIFYFCTLVNHEQCALNLKISVNEIKMIALDSFRALEGMIALGGEQSVKLVGRASHIILLMVNDKNVFVCVCVTV